VGRLAVWTVALALTATAHADDAVTESRVKRIAAELRCLVCQNQTIADSNAALAEDLRRQVREMIAAGRSDDEIIAFMTERYGDFVLYRPPLKETTALLWFGPAVLLMIGGGALILTLRRRSRLGAERFEGDPEVGEALTPALSQREREQ
jgi:cytochrome c-type biogenesis protein CcmH